MLIRPTGKLSTLKSQNINESLILLVGLHFLAAQHLQSTLHNQHFWHHGGEVPAVKLALGIAILTRLTSFLANNVSTTIARYSIEWLVNLLSASWFVSELSCQRVDCQRVDVSASWFVISESSCQRVDYQRVGLSERCLWSTTYMGMKFWLQLLWFRNQNVIIEITQVTKWFLWMQCS